MRIEDTPAFTNYPGERGQVRYGEGVFVGYRWYDTRRHRAAVLLRARALVHDVRARPADRVGHELRAARYSTANGARRRPVRNTGSRRGAEVVQCYVHDVEASVARPPQELKAFAKVWLDPGEPARRRRSSSTGARSRSGTSTPHDWVVEPGEFELRIGTSSRAIAHRVVVTVTE